MKTTLVIETKGVSTYEMVKRVTQVFTEDEIKTFAMDDPDVKSPPMPRL